MWIIDESKTLSKGLEECKDDNEINFELQLAKEIELFMNWIPDEIFIFPNEVRLFG